MKDIKYLPFQVGSVVLAFGLLGCGSDKISAPDATTYWSIGDQRYIRAANNPISLQNAEHNLLRYELGDQIQFVDLPKTSDNEVTLQMTAECLHDEVRFKPHTFREPAQSHYRIYELLPKEAIFNSFATPENPVRCGFKFLAKNKQGDSHEFEMRPSAIGTRLSSGFMKIQRSKVELARKGSTPFEIIRQNLGDYALESAGHFPDRAYELECQNLTGKIDGVETHVRFDQFRLKTRASSSLKPAELCRVFQIRSSDSKVIAVTDSFILRSPFDQPVVSTIKTAAASSWMYPREHIEVGQYLLRNPTSRNMILALKPPAHVHLTALTNFDRVENNGTTAAILKMPIHLTAPELASETTAGQTRFILPPQTSAMFTLKFTTHARCGSRQGHADAIYYRPASSEGIVLQVLGSYRGSLHPLNIFEEIILEKPFEKYAQARNAQEKSEIPLAHLQYVAIKQELCSLSMN